MFKKVNGELRASDSQRYTPKNFQGCAKGNFYLITESLRLENTCKIMESNHQPAPPCSPLTMSHIHVDLNPSGMGLASRDVRGAGYGTLRVTQLTEVVNYPGKGPGEKLWVSNGNESVWSLLKPRPCNHFPLLHTDQTLTLNQPSQSVPRFLLGPPHGSDPKSFLLLLSQRKNRGLVPHGPKAAQE